MAKAWDPGPLTLPGTGNEGSDGMGSGSGKGRQLSVWTLERLGGKDEGESFYMMPQDTHCTLFIFKWNMQKKSEIQGSYFA